MKLLDALIKIAERFNQKNINWNVGASLLLYFYNIVDVPNDIDLIIKAADKEKAFEIMNEIGEVQEVSEVDSYNTGIFAKFLVDSVEVDIIGDFEVLIDGGKLTYLHPYDEYSVSKKIKIRGVEIPLGSLEDWYITYAAMGDPKGRIELIERYFLNEGVLHKNKLKRIFSNLDINTKNYIKKNLNSTIV